MLLRRSYAEINNPVGIEANLAFLGFGFVLMGLFDLVFLPMHYKNGYDLGKPFVISSIVLFVAIVLLEALDHIVPYLKTVCESYISAVSTTVSGALEGLGKGAESLVIALCRYVVFIMPLAALLCNWLGADGAWHAFWLTEVLAAVVSGAVYRRAVTHKK